jgi:predicted nucleic acid-binding Zn ribbon protein
MYTTLLRLGLWTLVLVLATYVFRESMAEPKIAELIPSEMLAQALVVGVVLIVAGMLARLFGKGAKVVSKNRCSVCRTPIASGAIYCRAHLRAILQEEDEKTHMTRVRRSSTPRT